MSNASPRIVRVVRAHGEAGPGARRYYFRDRSVGQTEGTNGVTVT